MQYEIRSMSFGEILDTGFALLRNHFVPLVALCSIVSMSTAFAPLIVEMAAGSDPTLIVSGVAILLLLLIQPVISYAIALLICSHYQGRSVTTGDAIKEGAARYLSVMGTGLLATLFIMGGTLLLVIPGIYLALAYAFITPIMVVEGRFGTNATGRSRDLAKGHLWRIAGMYFLVFILSTVMNIGTGIFSLSLPILSFLLQGLLAAAVQAFMTAVIVALYFDIRCRKEDFDLEHLSSLVADGTTREHVSRPDPI